MPTTALHLERLRCNDINSCLRAIVHTQLHIVSHCCISYTCSISSASFFGLALTWPSADAAGPGLPRYQFYILPPFASLTRT